MQFLIEIQFNINQDTAEYWSKYNTILVKIELNIGQNTIQYRLKVDY